MISPRWRTSSLVLGVLCLVLLWRECSRAPERTDAACPPPHAGSAGTGRPAGTDRTEREDRVDRADRVDPAALDSAESAPDSGDDGLMLYGVKLPGWLAWVAPHPGEDLRAYRDRMLPLAVAAIAPQRSRVARGRDAFARLAHLDEHQRAELDAAAQETAAALQDRVLNAVLGGELSPSTFKPMTGVAVARDLLDIVGRGNRRFLGTLRDDQRRQLAAHPFDFGDYLVFSTHWEDALNML